MPLGRLVSQANNFQGRYVADRSLLPYLLGDKKIDL